jgi:hypothetical protein
MKLTTSEKRILERLLQDSIDKEKAIIFAEDSGVGKRSIAISNIQELTQLVTKVQLEDAVE